MTGHTLASSKSATTAADMQTQMLRPASRRVTDATTRMLHWLMALSFTGAYLSADGEHWQLVHVTLGYTLAGLLVCRVLRGLFGPRQVRLSVLWRRLKGLPDWLKSLPDVNSLDMLLPIWRQAQNLMMALAVALILTMILPLALSGYAVRDGWGGEWLEDVHAFFCNALLVLAMAHIGLIALLSLLRRKNLAMPMLTGRTAGPGPDLARRNHGILAATVLAGVMGFWGWQWSEAPQGTGNTASHGKARIDNHHKHSD